MKQLQEIGTFIEKCKAYHSLLLHMTNIKSESSDEKGNESYDDSKDVNSDNEISTKCIKRLFPCAKCNKHFSVKKHLLVHIKKQHTQRRSYICHDCNASFKNKQNLVHHRLLHNTTKLYNCHICGKCYK